MFVHGELWAVSMEITFRQERVVPAALHSSVQICS